MFLIILINILALFGNPGPCGDIPALNKSIVQFVNASLNKKIGRGECWDLAAQALNQAGAEWDGKYRFGNKVDYRTDCVFPGDIIQFEGVSVSYRRNNTFFEESMEHHTAVIVEVKEKGSFRLAEQNTAAFGRRVGVSDFDVKNVTSGTLAVYRPQAVK